MADATVKRVRIDISGSSQSLQSAVQKAKESLKGFDKQQQKTASFAGKLAKIMEYRLIRGGISKIMQGLEEGKKAIEAYDKALNGLSASKASILMREMAENTTLLQNTLASLFMTVYASVQPAINALVEALRGAMNMINQVISALIGRTTYTKAVKGWNSVTDAAKAYKKQIFGFDELNILKAPDGADTPDYSGAFEETDINPILQKIGEAMDKVKTNLEGVANIIDWDDIWQKVGAIGGAIALWRVGESLLNFVKTITTNPVYKIAIGATLFIVGFEGLKDAIQDALTNGLTSDNVAAMLLSSGAIVLGGLMVGQALGDAVLGGSIGAIVAGGLLLWNGIYSALEEGLSPASGFMIVAGTAILGTVFGALSPVLSAGLGGFYGLIAGGLVALGILVYQHRDEIASKLKEGWTLMKTNALSIWEEFKTGWQDIVSSIGNYLKEKKEAFKKSWEEFWNSPFDWVKEKFEQILGWIDKIKSFDFSGVSQKAQDTLSKAAEATRAMGYDPEAFASGGFPTTGDLFIANEAGPELVGSFGNRTSVYNQDQFAGAMAAANQAVVQAVYAIGGQITNAVDSKPVPSFRIGDRELSLSAQRGNTLRGNSLIRGGK